MCARLWCFGKANSVRPKSVQRLAKLVASLEFFRASLFSSLCVGEYQNFIWYRVGQKTTLRISSNTGQTINDLHYRLMKQSAIFIDSRSTW